MAAAEDDDDDKEGEEVVVVGRAYFGRVCTRSKWLLMVTVGGRNWKAQPTKSAVGATLCVRESLCNIHR